MTTTPPTRTNSFNHAFDLAFSLTSHDEQAADVTAPMLRHAIFRRLASLSDTELVEAVGPPFDTYQEHAQQDALPNLNTPQNGSDGDAANH